MKNIYFIAFCIIFSNAVIAQTDLDQDWMDDAWEAQVGLNAADENDAYKDIDGDNITNLFEYKLGSDPTDPNSPYTINFNPEEDLKSVLQSAPKGSVIRIPEGTHSLEWLKFFREDYNVMIQGGWSSDFSTYDPEVHRTVLDGGDFTVFNFGFLRNSTNVFIVEGLATRNNKDIFAPFDISFSDTSSTFVGIHRCHVSGMESGLKFAMYDNAIAQLSVTKNYLVENIGQGIDVTATDDVTTNFKILNNTIANNTLNSSGFFSGSGLEFTTLNNATMSVDFRNNIVWGNEKNAYELSGYGNPIEFTQYDYNLVMGNIDQKGDVNLPEPCCAKNTNPLFEEGSFKLSKNSNCIDQGMNLGFDFEGTGIDIGAHEYASITTSNKVARIDNLIKVFPNPASHNLNFTISSEIKGGIFVNIYTIDGKKIISKQYESNIGLFKIPISNLAKGSYILKVNNKEFTTSNLVQKI